MSSAFLTLSGHSTQIPSGKADECNRDFSLIVLSRGKNGAVSPLTSSKRLLLSSTVLFVQLSPEIIPPAHHRYQLLKLLREEQQQWTRQVSDSDGNRRNNGNSRQVSPAASRSQRSIESLANALVAAKALEILRMGWTWLTVRGRCHSFALPT